VLECMVARDSRDGGAVAGVCDAMLGIGMGRGTVRVLCMFDGKGESRSCCLTNELFNMIHDSQVSPSTRAHQWGPAIDLKRPIIFIFIVASSYPIG
jgi:hypothetical protein